MKYDATIKGCFIGPYLVFKFVKICERDLLIPPNTFPAKSVTQIHFPPKVMLRYSIIPLKKTYNCTFSFLSWSFELKSFYSFYYLLRKDENPSSHFTSQQPILCPSGHTYNQFMQIEGSILILFIFYDIIGWLLLFIFLQFQP